MLRLNRAGFNCRFIFLILLFLLVEINKPAAQNDAPSKMFRAYEDDDFLNDLGLGTDKAYTSGLQFTLFYNVNHKSTFFIDRLLPKAGDSSVNTCGIGLMQIMYTPDYLTTTYYVYNDYSYAGALVGKYSLYSFNPQKKYDLQTELEFGMMGPASFAKPAQRWLHNAIRDTAMPNGWDNQYGNAVMLNINFTGEKELYGNRGFEAVGSAQFSAGSMYDAIELSPTIYLGKMHPYFNGFMNHYSTSFAETEKGGNKIQFYFMIKTAAQYVLYNAMLQGGLFTSPPMVKTLVVTNSGKDAAYIEKPYQPIENFVCYAAYGPVLAYRHFCISYTQTYFSPVLKNVYSYIYGNITIYYSW